MISKHSNFIPAIIDIEKIKRIHHLENQYYFLKHSAIAAGGLVFSQEKNKFLILFQKHLFYKK